jgi:hypothetical protein
VRPVSTSQSPGGAPGLRSAHSWLRARRR